MAGQEKFDAAFPSRLRKLIKDRGTTITALAKELGISRQAVSQYTDGTGQPNVDKLVLIANFFGVSTDYLSGIAEYQNPENECVLAKDLGLSEQAINVLKFYAEYPEYPSFLHTLNCLIEQECPPPNSFSIGTWEGMPAEEYAEEEHRAEEEFEKEFKAWEQRGYSPILSTIDDFLSILRNDTKYDLLPTGEILKKKDGKGLRSIRIDALRTIKTSDVMEQILLSEIERGLRKLKEHSNIDKN